MHATANDGGKGRGEIAGDAAICIQRHFAKHLVKHTTEGKQVVSFGGNGFM